MSLLTIMPSGKTIEAAAGTSLLQAILAAGEKLATQCGGEAQCGACHVSVTEGRKSVNRMTPAENAKLDTLVGIGSKSRLACQVLMGAEPVTVELLGAI
ncbi:MAG: 2Fe-2S iron-sulfur cluster binding domain-containing protein [Burkholderiales bacterium]|nr:2Fe-2S iron-sulfur cluster binding domain-containing protein [Burkholderiales bacterium]